MSTPGSGPPVLFLHGYWHGSWCWAEVLTRVTAAGVRALAVDMAGHGLCASQPAALTRRPFDAGMLSTEVSPVADVGLDQAAELLVDQMKALGAGDPVIVVAHSMGGAVLTRAAQLATGLVAEAVYLTAYMPASGMPAVAYVRMPEHEGSLATRALVADPSAVGAFRIDVASPDPGYRQLLRDAFVDWHLVGPRADRDQLPIEFRVHLVDFVPVAWIVDQVDELQRIVAEVIQLRHVRRKRVRIADVLPVLGPQRADVGRIGELFLVVIEVGKALPPAGIGLTLRDLQPRSPLHVRRDRQADHVENGRREILVQDHLIDNTRL